MQSGIANNMSVACSRLWLEARTNRVLYSSVLERVVACFYASFLHAVRNCLHLLSV